MGQYLPIMVLVLVVVLLIGAGIKFALVEKKKSVADKVTFVEMPYAYCYTRGVHTFSCIPKLEGRIE